MTLDVKSTKNCRSNFQATHTNPRPTPNRRIVDNIENPMMGTLTTLQDIIAEGDRNEARKLNEF